MLLRAGFLADASQALHGVLRTLAREVRLAPQEVLFEQGDPGDALFAVQSGRLEVSVLSEDGRRLVLDVMRRGAILGEIALFDPGPRTATITAVVESRLLRVTNRDMMAAIARSPDLATDMIRLAGQRMRAMNRQIAEQALLPLGTRLARKLIYLSADEPDGGARLRMSQANLAEFVGGSREQVSKTLNAWKRAGVVEITRMGVRVCDPAGLAALAQADLG
jgi:CRP/FNR family transcriptional regulator, cyclic AMP receptor protein